MAKGKTAKETMNKFHRQGCQNYIKCVKNAVMISIANTKAHEHGKLEICYDIKKDGKNFITEAVSNETGERHDIVVLETGEIIEVDAFHGNIKQLLEKGYTVYKVEYDKNGIREEDKNKQ